MEDQRGKELKALRPEVPSAKVKEEMGKEEQFQNETIRPLIKFQHTILIAVFKNYLSKQKVNFYDFSNHKKELFIENVFKNDSKLKIELRGILLGQFSLEEYQEYCLATSAYNRRMLNIVKQRVLDSISELNN